MEGSAFELTVEATGGGELRYAWYFNDELIDGVLSSTYVVDNANFPATGRIMLLLATGHQPFVIANKCPCNAFLESPSIIQPNNKRVKLGNPSSIVVSAKEVNH